MQMKLLELEVQKKQMELERMRQQSGGISKESYGSYQPQSSSSQQYR